MFKIIRKIFLVLLVLLCIVGGMVFFKGYHLYQTAIQKQDLHSKIEEIRENKNYINFENLPQYYIDAVVSVEDHRFYQHSGIDAIGILRAIVSNIRQKNFVEGGSTITQQVAKNLYFITEEDEISRKVAEIIMAFELEKNYAKNDILEFYVNTIYFGDGYYGISEASHGYLNKEPQDMNFYDSTLLAGIPNAPSVYAPTQNLNLALIRQQKVIRSMIKYTDLTQETADTLFKTTKPAE